ncbi:MAG: PEP-CTERM sorting domain-containing protein [Gemmataceae bacterium]
MNRLISAVAWAVLIASTANAQTQLGSFAYNFAGTAPTQSFSSTNTSYVNSGTAVSFVGVTQTSLTDALVTKGWSNSTTGPDQSNYYQFGFTTSSTAPSAISLQNVAFNACCGNKSPTDFYLGWSTTATGSYTILPQSIVAAQNTTGVLTFNFLGTTIGNVNPGGSLFFRIYGNNANNNGNTEFGLQSVTGTDAIHVGIYTPVPEPASILVLTGLATSVLGFGLRRKSKSAAVSTNS